MATKKVAKKIVRKRVKREKPFSFELFLKAITHYYKDDRLSPGVVQSYLGDKKVWYASVTRVVAGVKKVVVKAEHETSIWNATILLSNKWKKMVAEEKDYFKEFMDE